MAAVLNCILVAAILVATVTIAESWVCNKRVGQDGLSEGSMNRFDSSFAYAHCYDHLSPDHFNASQNRNGIIPERFRWPWGQIPFVLEQSALSSPLLPQIYEGMQMVQDATCLRFFERTDQENYLTIKTTEQGCFCSGIGMRGGPQVVNLEYPGCRPASTAAHELLHAAGLWHEHTRPDRDEYIFVDFSNTCKENEHNYYRCDQGDVRQIDGCSAFDEPYNVNSIMHYPGLVSDRNFAIDPNVPIMSSRPGVPPIPNDMNSKITKEDAAKIQKMYNSCN